MGYDYRIINDDASVMQSKIIIFFWRDAALGA